jgi:hypothetical protein
VIVLVESSRDALAYALMWSGEVVVVDEFGDEAMLLLAMEDKYMLQAFSFEAADEPLALGVGFRCSKRRLQFLDTAAGSDGELLAVLVVSVVNEVLGHLTPRRGLT